MLNKIYFSKKNRGRFEHLSWWDMGRLKLKNKANNLVEFNVKIISDWSV